MSSFHQDILTVSLPSTVQLLGLHTCGFPVFLPIKINSHWKLRNIRKTASRKDSKNHPALLKDMHKWVTCAVSWACHLVAGNLRQLGNKSILAIFCAQCLLFLAPIPYCLWLELSKALDLPFPLLQVGLTNISYHPLLPQAVSHLYEEIKENVILIGRNYDSGTR